MPAIGSCWASGSWDDDAWAADTWATAVAVAVILILSDVRSLTPALLATNLTPDLTASVME